MVGKILPVIQKPLLVYLHNVSSTSLFRDARDLTAENKNAKKLIQTTENVSIWQKKNPSSKFCSWVR